jgi:hypothetical protein
MVVRQRSFFPSQWDSVKECLRRRLAETPAALMRPFLIVTSDPFVEIVLLAHGDDGGGAAAEQTEPIEYIRGRRFRRGMYCARHPAADYLGNLPLTSSTSCGRSPGAWRERPRKRLRLRNQALKSRWRTMFEELRLTGGSLGFSAYILAKGGKGVCCSALWPLHGVKRGAFLLYIRRHEFYPFSRRWQRDLGRQLASRGQDLRRQRGSTVCRRQRGSIRHAHGPCHQLRIADAQPVLHRR